jgi:hypothetical protein
MDDPNNQGSNVEDEFLAALERATVADERFRETGDRTILMEGLNFWAEVIRQPDIEEAPLTERANMLREYGLLLLTFHEASGRVDALQEANRVFEEASNLDPTGLPWPAWVLSRRAVALRARYDQRGEAESLDRAIAAYEEALGLISGDPSEKGKLRVNLANALRARFWRAGNRLDLEAALDHYERAVADGTADPYDRAIMLNGMGLSRLDRFVIVGDLADLERAVGLFEQAVALTPLTAQERASVLGNLGLALSSRHELRNRSHDHLGAAQDLVRAIDAFEEGLRLAPRHLEARSTLLHHLGNALEARYQETGDPSDLEQAVTVLEEAVAETPVTAPEYASIIDDLGVRLRIRYQTSGRVDDLHRAIAAHEQAIEHVAPSVPDRTSYLNNLAGIYWLRYERTDDPDDLERAVTAYREGSHCGLESNLKEGLKTAAGWGSWALARQSWQEAVEALGLGMEIAHRLFRTQFSRQHKETWLAHAEGVAVGAAYALALTGDPDGAIVALEQGRALLLSESLERTQADLVGLEELGHTELAARYHAAADSIGELERGELAAQQQTFP